MVYRPYFPGLLVSDPRELDSVISPNAVMPLAMTSSQGDAPLIFTDSLSNGGLQQFSRPVPMQLGRAGLSDALDSVIKDHRYAATMAAFGSNLSNELHDYFGIGDGATGEANQAFRSAHPIAAFIGDQAEDEAKDMLTDGLNELLPKRYRLPQPIVHGLLDAYHTAPGGSDSNR